ncbi:ATP-dependent protease La [Paramicrosporidium saccamoebae]|uniref:Lon protease homolog, mitochondrial n=1 Tax=Paramicrosporidium saccamoebae TaxID=1246581 RepID=A0A2H9TJM1_9FUNG|nr:ATP-dependent protease La [Paramicrosporidium saccamoebae]
MSEIREAGTNRDNQSQSDRQRNTHSGRAFVGLPVKEHLDAEQKRNNQGMHCENDVIEGNEIVFSLVLPPIFLANIRAKGRRNYSSSGNDGEDSERPLAEVSEEAFNEEEDIPSEENEERSLVKATVPEFYPEVLAVPVSRRPIFPGFYKTISVKDARVAAALTQALKKGRPYVGLFLHKNEDEGESIENDSIGDKDIIQNLNEIHRTGVFAQIVNVIPMPTEGMTAIVYPHRRIRATELISSPEAAVSHVRTENVKDEYYDRKDRTIRAISQEIFAVLADVAKLNAFFREHITHHNVPTAVFEDASKLADFVAVLSTSEPSELQEVLEETRVEERLRKALVLLKKELVTAQLQNSISKDVEQKLTQKQREYFLHEQLKTIKKELGLETDSKEKLLQMFNERISKITMPDHAKRVFDEPSGAEFNVTRNYLDWLTQLPWGQTSPESLEIQKAVQVLDEDHYGLEDVKERILEFIAISKLKGCVSGKILCLVGPPGVGKTSIGKSIARALGREYFRFSVGGLSDVAEIKGHRRTYVGAMPGKMVQALKKVKCENPLILVDEIDKLGRGNQGDPASALLELLDPEQNNSFLDHYLDVPLDLGKVLFMCTANQIDTIPAPLLDRMEVINLSGYVAQEKLEIAKKYLVPQSREAAGINEDQVKLSDASIEALVRQYCRESGVRSLKKHIEKIFRKAALKIVKAESSDSAIPIHVEPPNLKDFVGNPVFTSDRLYESKHLPVGVVTGLAWTSMGGSILYIETILERVLSESSDKHNPGLIRTGQLGDVMKESSSIAYSFAKSFVVENFPDNRFFEKAALHLHVPEGATPKDGPSAGCTMATSLLSQALGKPLQSDIAMTGELTLTGKILRIGGVKEKTIAAKRSGVKKLIFPKSNEADWSELPDYIRDGLEVKFVESYKEIAKLLKFL